MRVAPITVASVVLLLALLHACASRSLPPEPPIIVVLSCRQADGGIPNP